MYRKNEQEFLENFVHFICQANTENIDGDHCDANDGDIKFIHKSLVEICRDYDLSRYADKYKSSVSDLNKLCNIKSINANSGKSLSELIVDGGCIYIVGDLLDETMKKIQRFIFCRVVQLARNHANEADRNGTKEQNITVFADELVAHISRFVAESYTVSLGWGLKIVSAIQDLKLLKGAPADLDPDFLIGAIFGNSQNKLFYRADDIATADFLSDMTGKIQIEEEQKLVTRNSLNSEKLDKQTRLIQSERNYFDRNMILNLKQFEAVFCASLGYRNTIASLCKTSPVIIKQNGNNVVNGKKLIEVIDIQNNYEYENQGINTQDSTNKNDDSNEVSTISDSEQLFLDNWRDELNKHNALINELTQTTKNIDCTENQEFIHTKNYTNTNGENNANNQPRNNNRNSQTKENSTSKPDYLF
ncbi:MAG: TraM recognition domain-containing protein [Burkholderiales bacterium]|nr:TraM recognition domain-containing protein [Burkholderiales bacterium]